MQSLFIPADELKKRYSVLGHFYAAKPAPTVSLRSRSVLELLVADRASEVRQGHRGLPDAVFIMMNPGSSRPLNVNSDNSDQPNTSSSSKTLVLTKPDTTQYQLMRVMAQMNWGHVRVLNLSDLREPKSDEFAKTYKRLERDFGFKEHSLFAPLRKTELATELKRRSGAPLVCAWGVSSSLDSLINTAIPVLTAAGKCTGLRKSGAPGKYFHPLPTLQADKEAWVSGVCGELRVDA